MPAKASVAEASLAAAGRRRSIVDREQRSDADEANNTGSSICWFCQTSPAAISVQLPVRGSQKRRAPQPYCLQCYYTTSAVRQNEEKYVSVMDESERDNQLPRIQTLFSESFLELQDSIGKESARAFSQQHQDPLKALVGAGAARKKQKRQSASKAKEGREGDGGFIRSIPLPKRFKQAQDNTQINMGTHRRKESRKPIWNLVLNNDKPAETSQQPDETESNQGFLVDSDVPACISCGSTGQVTRFGNVTSRNQDLRKGETWGMKDRADEVVGRYRCGACGRMWNEEA